jgi:hypothetical protein
MIHMGTYMREYLVELRKRAKEEEKLERISDKE